MNPILKILGVDATAPAWASAQRTAASGIDGIKQMIPGLAQVLSAAGMVAFAKHTIDAGDALANMSEKTGQSVESLSKWKYIAEQNNTTLEKMQPALKTLATNMAEAAAGGKTQAEIFARMGVPIKDAEGNLRSLDDVAMDVADVFAKMPDGAQKSALAVQVFGKAGQDMIPMLNKGSEALKQMGVDAENMGLVMSTEAAESAAEFNDALDLLKSVAEGLGTTLLEHTAHGINEVAQAMANATKNHGLLAGLMVGYGEAWKQLVFDGNKKRGAEEQRQWIRDMQAEYAKAAKDLEYVEKAGVLGRASMRKSAEEYRQDLARLNITISQAITSLRLMEEEAAKPRKQKTGTPLNTGDITGEQERARKAAEKAAAEAARLAEEQGEAVLKAEAEWRAIQGKNAVEAAKEAEELEAKRFAAFVANQEREAQLENAAMEATNRTREETARIAAQAAEKWAAFRERIAFDLADDHTRARVRYEEDMNALWEARAKDAMNEAEYQRLSAARIRQYEAQKTSIADEEIKKRWNTSVVFRKLDLDSAAFFANQMGALMLTNSKKQFEIGKAAAISGAIIDTYKAATGAYAALAEIKFIGPVLGAAAAAAAIAAGMARVQAIRSQQFGAGSGAVGTFAASPSTGLPVSPTSSGFSEPAPSPIAQSAQIQRRMHLTFSFQGGGRYTAEEIRDGIIPVLKEALADGYEL